MGPRWGRQDPGGAHVGPMNLAIWVEFFVCSPVLHPYIGICLIHVDDDKMNKQINHNAVCEDFHDYVEKQASVCQRSN